MTTTQPAIPAAELTEAERVAADLRRLLPSWIGAQRWFAGKDHALVEAEPVLVDVLWPGEAALVHTVVRTGPDDWYQLLVGVRTELPGHLAAAAIGHGTASAPRVLYDATADPELMGRLIELLGAERSDAAVEFHRMPGADIPAGLPARLLGAEQSNTSVAFGDRMIFKVLRHLVHGPSPELELLGALRRAGNVPSAAPLGWLRTAPGALDGEIVLGILQEFVPSRGDGWALAVAEARACLTGAYHSVPALDGFTEESRALGRATAEVHAALAAQLGTEILTADGAARLADTLDVRLATALAEVPALLPYARQLRELYRDLADAAGKGLAVQRVHGDLHLGQVLRGEPGWVLIDFEGEPGRPPEERRRPQPALRDVAAMLRSFDYAAHHALAEVLGAPPGEGAGEQPGEQPGEGSGDQPGEGPGRDPRGIRLARRASAWAVHNRRAFCAGYAEAGGADPRVRPVLLRAFEADKAVYEALYEARNRPEWLAIPVAAVRGLAIGRPGGLSAATAPHTGGNLEDEGEA
ncbi:phosphotransferase [Streptomyces sp. NPDC048361]|uniref:maltokinase N-terminal cap-like domain-containing protein n=1 Tax=Streptomyces sp. NPDC048361 TaxID=3154720 RepID=UPI00343F713E